MTNKKFRTKLARFVRKNTGIDFGLSHKVATAAWKMFGGTRRDNLCAEEWCFMTVLSYLSYLSYEEQEELGVEGGAFRPWYENAGEVGRMAVIDGPKRSLTILMTDPEGAQRACQ